MIWIVGIFIVCVFITLWVILTVCDSNNMSIREFFTGSDISKSWQNDIINLQKEIKKQDERISRLESTLYIAEEPK